MSLIIRTSNLSKSFAEKKVLKDISLNIKKGLSVGLVGHNGAGKTTLFSLLCGYLQPNSGEIEILGSAPASPNLSGRLSILPQDASFVAGIKVGQQLTMLAELQGFSSKDAVEEARRVLEIVSLSKEWEQLPEKLSHGMLKRIAIAQAFIGEPELILLDEPTAGLDPESAKKIRDLIRKKQHEITFVISSHNLEDIEDLCQEILILKSGQLTHHENIADLTARENVLTFRMEEEIPENVEQLFSKISQITSVKKGKEGERKLVLYFQSSDNDALLEIDILKCLATANLRYREMVRGERLADKVLDMSN